MAANSLANLRTCVAEFDTEQTKQRLNLDKSWKSWKENLEVCMEFEEVPVEKREKALLAVGGQKLRQLCETLEIKTDTSYAEAITLLDAHFKAKKNCTAERYKFFCMRPLSNEESHDQWLTRLKTKVNDCDFDKFDKNEAMKLVITLHTKLPKLQREIIANDHSLDKTMELARSIEMTEEEMKFLKDNQMLKENTQHNPEGSEFRADQVNIRRMGDEKRRWEARSRNQKSTTCRYCGDTLPHRNTCKAKFVTCNNCHRKGHFAKVCEQKNKGYNNAQRANATALVENTFDTDNYGEIIDALLIRAYQIETDDGIETRYPSTTIKTTINGCPINMKVDSQAEANIIGENHLRKLGHHVNLEPSQAKIRPYGSPLIPVLGKFNADLKTNKAAQNTTVYVVKGHQEQALLSKYTAFDLGILQIDTATVKANENNHKETNHLPYAEITKKLTPKQVVKEKLKAIYKEETDSQKRVDRIIQQYSNVFIGIGKHKYRQVKLTVDPEVEPKIQPQRKIAFAKRSKLDALLEELESADIIELVEGPTDWISNIVITPKANPEEIRMNIDMTCVNKAILRTRHTIPALDELRIKLNGAKHFSKLDMRHGYMQLELHPDSRHLTTFYTHDGLRRSKRLIFGANAAAEIFHEEIRRAIGDIDGLENIYDDMLGHGKTQLEHDFTLIMTLQRLEDLGLTLNKPKCKINKKEAIFFGMKFTEEGMAPTEDRVQALWEASPPKTVQEIRSFLGMANFSAPFIKEYSIITAPLRELTKKEAHFSWTDTEQKAFIEIKKALSQDTVMIHFDPNGETKLIVDGSKKDGISSILAQKDPETQHFRVVRYDSRSTTKAEKNYAPIEVESLSVKFGCLKNFLYLHGLQHFIVSTDHKPLLPLYNKYRKEMPLRVNNHKISLQGKFNFTLIWEPGIDNPADYNSRHPSGARDSDDETELRVETIVMMSVPQAIGTEEVATATLADPELTTLRRAIDRGYPTSNEQTQIKAYLPIFDELSIVKDMVCRGEKIIVPIKLQKNMIEIAHESHQGLAKTKQYLRDSMWFPRMDRLVEEKLQSCLPCQAVTQSQQKEPLNISSLPDKPWEELCTDIFGPLPTGEYIVLVQDLHSRYPEVAITNSTSAKTVIPAIDKILASYGTPQQMMSDNGPPYNSEEFRAFARRLGFKHRKIVPASPWVNGTAENFMKNLAKVCQIARIEQKNWRQELVKFLRAYRATPHTMTGVAPAASLFNGRKYKTGLPSIKQDTPNNLTEKAKAEDAKSKDKMKRNADQRGIAKDSTIKQNDKVLCKQQKLNKLSTLYDPNPYTVIRREGSLITARNEQRIITRHVNFFKKIHENRTKNTDQDAEEYTIVESGDQSNNDEQPAGGSPAGSPRRSSRNRRPPNRYRDLEWQTEL